MGEKNYMGNWIPIVISIISLVVSFIGIGFNIYWLIAEENTGF